MDASAERTPPSPPAVDVTPSASPQRADASPATAAKPPSDATPETSASESPQKETTGEKGQEKLWFHRLPVVLQNVQQRGQEQIKQLTLPRCTVCARREINQKADVACQEKGCLLYRRALCSACWTKTHSSEEAKRHRQAISSNCPQCRLTRASFWCAECDLQFCSDCFCRIHSVRKVRQHRKIAVEDSPGTYLSKSTWSVTLLNDIIAVKKQKLGLSGAVPTSEEIENRAGDAVGGKRKRDAEVITIDDSDDDTETTQVASERTADSLAVTRHIDGSSSAFQRQQEAAAMLGTAYTDPNHALVPTNFPGASFQVPATQLPTVEIPEPMPFPQELAAESSTSLPLPATSFASSAPSMQQVPMYSAPPATNTSSGVGVCQWSYGVPQSNGVSMNSLSSSGDVTFATTTMNHDTMGTIPMSAGLTSAGMWGTNSALSTDLASTSSNFIPLGTTVFAENPLVDSLVDRYNEVNRSVLQLELKIEHLSKQIAAATYQGLYAANPLMNRLNETKAVLGNMKAQRNKLLIGMIIQSRDIMSAVRHLRLTELANVPQVPVVSHRKILQLSIEINSQKRSLMGLNRQMAVTLNEPSTHNASALTAAIQNLSNNIKVHEQNIQRLKQSREAEIVRIVQFSHDIREELKAEFQRMQRQQAANTYG